MALKGVDYNELSERLIAIGVNQSATNLRSKINSGRLGAQLFLYLQIALEIKSTSIDDVKKIYEDVARTKSDTEVSEPTKFASLN